MGLKSSPSDRAVLGWGAYAPSRVALGAIADCFRPFHRVRKICTDVAGEGADHNTRGACAPRTLLATQAGKAVLGALAGGCLMALAAGCASTSVMKTAAPASALAALQRAQEQFAPDTNVAVFNVTAHTEGNSVVLDGEVDNPAAKEGSLASVRAAGFQVTDRIRVLPDSDLGDRTWGLATLSLVNMREKPGNGSEMGTQAYMGAALRVWKSRTNWFLVQTPDGYLGWTEGGAFVPCTSAEAKAWADAPRLMITAPEERILEQPSTESSPVSDVVQCDVVKLLGAEGNWFKVALPDGRAGFLPKAAAEDLTQWQASRRPTPENIERTAKSLMGRPYFWGCNSARGLDCSGFTKLVYFLNGVDLNRNASQQCRQGVEVPLDHDFQNLKKGDLLFFGRRDGRTGVEKITHVGIYLDDKKFIHASILVHISSLDPASPLSDRRRIRSLLHARRILPGV